MITLYCIFGWMDGWHTVAVVIVLHQRPTFYDDSKHKPLSLFLVKVIWSRLLHHWLADTWIGYYNFWWGIRLLGALLENGHKEQGAATMANNGDDDDGDDDDLYLRDQWSTKYHIFTSPFKFTIIGKRIITSTLSLKRFEPFDQHGTIAFCGLFMV